MARGIERREIFRDNKDRATFLNRLALILEKTQTQCYAWALIPNHFHALLRTSHIPLSKIMRRLMTGHAVYFNNRHKRCGHLFQNRYKSVVCEEDSYLLELIRYIHLNPLRAGLVKTIEDLDNYPWTGHSAILGHCKNPLIPEQSSEPQRRDKSDKPDGAKKTDKTDQPAKTLAEKTVEDILLHFGDSLKIARRKYREFVKNGIGQGTRPDLQGGGLVRIAGGDAPVFYSRDKENHELSDPRILGSGEFVSATLQRAERDLMKKYRAKRPLEELVALAAKRAGLEAERIGSQSRQKKYTQARSHFAWLAVEEEGYPAAMVARFLGMSRVGVKKALDRWTQE